MKRIASFVIVLVMILTTAQFALPSSAVEGLPIAEVEAPYFDVKPQLDGIVSEEEWGEPTVWVDQQDAAKVYSAEDRPDASDLNTFFYRNPGAGSGYDVENLNMSYMMWLRWDEDYFYMAVKVYDPDGHSLKNSKKDLWNGDAFQARIDPEGSNASCPLGPEFYDAEYDGSPWSRGDVSDLLFGYVQGAGGYNEAWDVIGDKGMTSASGGGCIAEIVPCYGFTKDGEYYSEDAENGVTTYEIALPWTYIDTFQHEYADYSSKTPNGAIGREYGMSAVVYNSDEMNSTAKWQWNAGLEWGSGIIHVQENEYVETCGGSNKVTLSGDTVSGDPSRSDDYPNGPGYEPLVIPHEYDTEINESRHVKLTYDNARDMDTYGGDISGERVRDENGNWVVRWDKSNYTESGLNDRNYLSTEWNYHSPGCKFTMEFDLKVTDLQTFEGGYPATVYNWFGGSSTVDYECGYDFDMGKFIVRESDSGKILAENRTDFTLNEWHHWVFQYNKDTSEMRFYFDPKMENGRVARDAEPMFSMIYRYFDCPGKNECELIFRRLNAQIMMDNVEFYNFVDFPNFGPEVTVLKGDVDGDGNVNMKDVLLLRKTLAGADEFDPKYSENADVNSDGHFDMKDVLMLRKILAGAE